MSFARLSVERPVLTLVLSALIVVAGSIGFTRLGVREFPAVDPPTISVSTTYPGAAAEVIESQITQPLEEAINAVAGLETISSVSREGASVITAEFALDTDLDAVASDVRDQLSRAVRNLPPDCNPPIITKANADGAPIFGLVLRSEARSPLELSALAERLKEQLQTVPGVAQVDQPGERRYAMRLWMDPTRLASYGLSPLDVRHALQRENIELPSGRIEGESVELPVKTLSRLRTPAEFDALVIKREQDRIVRFRDVGYAELGALNERASLKVGLTPVAGLFFRPQPGANQVEIVDAIKARLARIERDLPDDVTVEIFFDNTEFVRRSIAEVEETILIAFALVLLVVFLFLREWRSTLIPVVAIPVSIIGTFALLAAAGCSINTLTLLGVVLAIGLVVDDAIVVLENIYTKIEEGMPPRAAAIAGTREILLAVIATTVVLAAVFLPLLFLGGLSGRLFREFGVTIAGAVLISALVALTLTPMLCSRLLHAPGVAGHGRLHRLTEPAFVRLESIYRHSLGFFLRHAWLAPVVLALTGAGAWWTFRLLPHELSPLEDRGRIWVRASAAEGAGYEYTQEFMDDLTALVMERAPEARLVLTQTPAFSGGGPGAANSGHVRLFLPDREHRVRSQQDIAEDLQRAVRDLSGARVNVVQEASIGDRRSATGGVQMVIFAPTIDDLGDVQDQFLENARRHPAFTFVDTNLKFNKPELRVSIDRDKAQALGVSAIDIAQTLQAALSGQRFGYFILAGKQYEVIGQLSRDFRSRPADLGDLTVRSAQGTVVRLDNLVQVDESGAPPELYRYNRNVAATITATLARHATLGDGITALEEVAARVLDDRFTVNLTGSARDFRESSASLGWVFALAVLFVYLALAAQFESFRDPFVILVTVPLALAGALAGLWLCGQSLNLYSQIGLIMLVGLITKNGILIVEFANQRRAADQPDAAPAVHEAAVARLRPILMTTLATILGALPIALALGAGAESRVSMGIAVIGGLLSGGALTLYVIPATSWPGAGRRRTPRPSRTGRLSRRCPRAPARDHETFACAHRHAGVACAVLPSRPLAVATLSLPRVEPPEPGQHTERGNTLDTNWNEPVTPAADSAMKPRLTSLLLLLLSVACGTLTRASDAAPVPAPDDPACTADDRKFMARAFELARKASLRGDNPIGAVLVKDGRIICEFGNTVNTDSDPTMHGETGLISYASHVLERSLWEGSTLYTSLEPCLMCTGSIHWAGIKTVVYGGTTRQPSGSLWGPQRLRIHEVYARHGWDIEVRGPLMDAEHLKIRTEHQARLATK